MHAIGVRPTRAYPHGLGIVLKIADGDVRHTIRPLVIKLVLQKLGLPCDASAFARFIPSTVNHRKIEVMTILNQLKEHR